MADMTSTTAATYLPTVWSKLASIAYRTNVVLPDLVDRRWEPELGLYQGKTVNIPNFTQNAAANTRTTFGTGAAPTFTAVTESQTVLNVNLMAYKAFRVPVEIVAQMFDTYIPLLTEGIGIACAIKVDSDVATNTLNFTGNTAVGVDNVDVTDDDILTTEVNLAGANAPLDNRFLVVSPATHASFLKIDRLANQLFASSLGKIEGTKGRGYIGHVYTQDVYESNNLVAGTSGKKNASFHREASALVIQKELTVEHTLNLQDGVFDQYLGYITYGMVKVKDNTTLGAFGTEVDGK